jgi:predicted XRE-type DNA-binding protein
MEDKLLRNAIIGSQLSQFTRQEKHDIVKKLLSIKKISQRKLAEDLGVPYSTLHDWVSLRQDNTKDNMHISLLSIYAKLSHLEPKNITDWGRIEMIKDKCEDLLREKQNL